MCIVDLFVVIYLIVYAVVSHYLLFGDDNFLEPEKPFYKVSGDKE
jgi:hypothetical protein